MMRGVSCLHVSLAGGACAAALLAAICATPAAAHPYDQYIRGRSFFGALFGPSIARTVVSYPTNQKPGTIVISTAQRRLYLVLGNGQALSYAIAVGAAGHAWSGVSQVSDKREWPDWTPLTRCCTAGPISRTIWRAARTIRWGHARSISARASIAFTVRTSPTRSGRRYRRAASA